MQDTCRYCSQGNGDAWLQKIKETYQWLNFNWNSSKLCENKYLIDTWKGFLLAQKGGSYNCFSYVHWVLDFIILAQLFCRWLLL